MFALAEDPTNDIAHRPWPLRRGPWIMAQRWNNLLFAHWPIDASRLRDVVPATLPIDTFDSSAWVSITPFYLSHLRARWLPALPWISEFPELNVRTYVTFGGKAGVYFFSLDAGSALAVAGARATFFLPYFRAEMTALLGTDGKVRYRSRRTDPRGRQAEFACHYRATGPANRPQPGTLDHFLTERYCLYSIDHAARLYRAEIHHHPWPLQPAEAQIEVNTMASAANIQLPSVPPRLQFAERLDVVIWPPERANGAR